ASDAFTFGSSQQVAFSADGAQLHLYLNGVEVASADYLGKIAVGLAPYLSMGAVLTTDITDPQNPVTGPAATPNFMTGGLDDVAIWNRSLTAEEVSLIYQAGVLHKPVTSVTLTPPAGAPALTLTNTG